MKQLVDPAAGDRGVQLYLLRTLKSGGEPVSTWDGIKRIIYHNLSDSQIKPSEKKGCLKIPVFTPSPWSLQS